MNSTATHFSPNILHKLIIIKPQCLYELRRGENLVHDLFVWFDLNKLDLGIEKLIRLINSWIIFDLLNKQIKYGLEVINLFICFSLFIFCRMLILGFFIFLFMFIDYYFYKQIILCFFLFSIFVYWLLFL